MMPLPTARPDCAAGSASGGAAALSARIRQAAGAGLAFFRGQPATIPALLLTLVLAACGTVAVDEAPARPAPAAAPPAAAPAAASERQPEARVGPADEPRKAAVPAPAKAPEQRPREAPPSVPDSRTPPRSERPGADAIPLPAPPTVERRETPPPPLPRVAREPVPQVRAGDDVVALAVKHGFDPVPVAVPENTRFSRLRIGMTKQDAEALLGRPDSALHYANEGARIPFYASDDSSRWETFYRGQGRLMFSGAWLTGEVRLIRIEFDAAEDGEPDPDHPQRDRR